MIKRMALALAALLMPAAAAAQYETPVNPPDPAAQLAEMIALYDEICLRAFPSDQAVAQAMAAHGAAPMASAEVRIYLHDDPGRGWNLTGRTAPFQVTLEAPPYHACGIRTMTVAGFPDMAPYHALARRFEGEGGYRSFGPQSMDMDDIQTTGAGEQRALPNGAEALMVFLTTPSGKHRDAAHQAVEVRFVHQFAPPQ
ncbi:MAG: hypothetical protein JO276_10545 [Sphingomonadaceae bacterium]|nr:hypothetical protein [Sphingomonadaceae bacterium]